MTTGYKFVLGVVLWTVGNYGYAQGVDVTAKFVATAKAGAAAHKGARQPALSGVVLWLTPVDDAGHAVQARTTSIPKSGYHLIQKDKMFTPHLLVVPTGSSVDFPNLDPFFHNVFSLFNGKRFDLGLYESGTNRSVRFDREGVSYIFCNIHPEMGAVVLSLSSPYFAVSDADGTVTIHGVPPGRYHAHVWGERYQAADTAAERRLVQVTGQGTALGNIGLAPGADPLMNHKNKFGEDYPTTPVPTY